MHFSLFIVHCENLDCFQNKYIGLLINNGNRGSKISVYLPANDTALFITLSLHTVVISTTRYSRDEIELLLRIYNLVVPLKVLK